MVWNEDNTESFKPPWHQLVRIYCMVQRAFTGESILLMNKVGLGKTLQVIGLIVVLEWYHEYYEQHKLFSREFSEHACPCFTATGRVIFWKTAAKKKFASEDGNILCTPSVLVVPVNLIGQMTSKLHWYLKHGEFDVLPYLGMHKTRLM